MSEHKIKTLSNISPIGLEALSKTECVLDEEFKDPDGAVSYTHLTLPTKA